jgi:hypothetical protein
LSHGPSPLVFFYSDGKTDLHISHSWHFSVSFILSSW